MDHIYGAFYVTLKLARLKMIPGTHYFDLNLAKTRPFIKKPRRNKGDVSQPSSVLQPGLALLQPGTWSYTIMVMAKSGHGLAIARSRASPGLAVA